MKIVYPRSLGEKENLIVRDLSVKCGILPETAQLLYYRGIDTYEKVKRFLTPGKKWFYDPLGLSDMKNAVDRITIAKKNKEGVLVFGDYDADGICATTILCGCLKIFGIDALKAIPEREEGYGLNLEKINKIKEQSKIDLIITVDCGISDAEKIRDLKSQGIDVIVTDHHEPPEILPDTIKINPKIKGQNYPFDGLCGGGVAYKLGYALIGEKADEFLDFAALATVADSMDLIDENRDIVTEGLKIFNRNLRPVFSKILDEGKEVTAQTLAFSVAPKINAGGRMGNAGAALKLFSAENEKDIFDLSAKLCEYNLFRQADCEEVIARSKQIIKQTKAYEDRIILVKGEEWKAGVIGIVAAKLAEIYDKPAIVFAKSGNMYKGSARSVEGLNIYDAVNYSKDLLITYGGHSQAAGLSVSEENFDKLRKTINDYAAKYYKRPKEKEMAVDFKAEEEISVRFAREIEALEPFGVGNRRPLFTAEVNGTVMTPLKEGSPHYSFSTPAVEILDFNGGKDVEIMACPIKKTIIFELNLSVFKRKESLKGFLKTIDYDENELKNIGYQVFQRELRIAKDKETCSGVYIPRLVHAKVEYGYGKAYVVSNIETLKSIPKGLKVYPYEIPISSGENCVVISPRNIPEEYDEVIYLDATIRYYDFNKRSRIFKPPFSNTATKLSVKREDFAEAFAFLSAYIDRPFKELSAAIVEQGEKTEQFIFCLEVFSELGIFNVFGGKLHRNYTVKRKLKESSVYRIVEERSCLKF